MRWVGLVLFLIVGCAHKSVIQEPTALEKTSEAPAPSIRVESEARALFGQAEKLRNNGKYDEAIEIYRLVRSRYPNGKAAMYSSYRTATCHYFRGDYAAASAEFNSFLSHYPKNELVLDATYNLAATEFQQRDYQRAYELLSKLSLKEVQSQGPKRAEVIFKLTGQSAAALHYYPAAVVAFAYELALPIGDSAKSEASADVDSNVAKIEDVRVLERLLGEITEASVQERLRARIQALAVPAKPESGARAPAPPTDPALAVNQAARRGESKKIGVLLPLTGKFSEFGKAAFQAMVLSSSLLSNGSGEIEMVVGDTASQPLIAERELERLVNEERVMGVIGPLHGREAQVVAQKCQAMGVPNLTLSTREGLSEMGPFVFQNALTPRVQVDSLIEYAVKEKGMRRFAILAPNDSFGRDMVDQFWQAVERNGGAVVGYETYSPDAKDFQNQVQSLVGLGDAERFRKMEVTKLKEFIAEQKKKIGREPRVNLPAIIDFDGLFIPDTSKNVAQVAASLRFFDVNGVTLMGTSDWGSGELARRGGGMVEGAIFPGAMVPTTRNGAQRQFMQEYHESYATQPDLVAAQASEAYQIFAHALHAGHYTDRDRFAAGLATIRDWQTLLGTISFDERRSVQRKLAIYSIGSGGELVEF